MTRPRRKPRCHCCIRGTVCVDSVALPTLAGPMVLRGPLMVPCPFCRDDWRPRGCEPAFAGDDVLPLPAPFVDAGLGRLN